MSDQDEYAIRLTPLRRPVSAATVQNAQRTMTDIWMTPSPQIRTTKGQRNDAKLRREQAYEEAQALGYTGEDLGNIVLQKLMDQDKLRLLFSDSPAGPPLPTSSSDPFCFLHGPTRVAPTAAPAAPPAAPAPLAAATAAAPPLGATAPVPTDAAAFATAAAPAIVAPASAADVPPSLTRKRAIARGSNAFQGAAKRRRPKHTEDVDELLAKWQLEEELDHLDLHVAMDLGLTEDGITEEDAALAKEFWEDFNTGAGEHAQPSLKTSQLAREHAQPSLKTSQLAHAQTTSGADIAAGPCRLETSNLVHVAGSGRADSNTTRDNEALRVENQKLKTELDAMKKQLETLQVDHFTLIVEMSAADVAMANREEAFRQEEHANASLRDDLALSHRTIRVFQSALGGAVRLMARAQQAKLLRTFSAGVKRMLAHVDEDLTGIVNEISDLPRQQTELIAEAASHDQQGQPSFWA